MKLKAVITHSLVALLAFVVGLITCLSFSLDYGSRIHARDETRMAEFNSKLAIEKGDEKLQRYLEDIIVWNTVLHLSPAYRNNRPLVIDSSWIFPERTLDYGHYKRSIGDWEDVEIINRGLEENLLIYEK